AMSATYPVNELRDELVCAICLEPFKDPVILDCGHNYCQACITGSWGASGTGLCPQCRKPLPEAALRPNKQLEAVVGIARDLEGECKKHQEVLKLFCKKDRTLICRVCRESREHRAHTVIPIEAAAEELKVQLLSHRARVQRVRDERGGRAAAEERECQTLLDNKCTSDSCQKQEVVPTDRQNNVTDFLNVEPEGDIGHWFDSMLRRRGAWKPVAAVVAAVLLAVLLTAVIVGSVSKASVTPPNCPTACCPENWIGYQGKCYLFSEDEADWTSSQHFCSSHGVSLAWLDTLQEKVMKF
ncbi:hypothetical protein KIL84_004161, partial [Mauremys mutica]